MHARHLIVPAALAAAVLSTAAFARVRASEAEVRAALEHYLQGHATGDGSHFRMVFHPDARLHFIRNGQFASRTAADYIAGASGRPAADEAQRRRRIVSVDVTGDAAQARIELDYPTVVFTDYFNLLKIDGKWLIVDKTYHARQKR